MYKLELCGGCHSLTNQISQNKGGHEIARGSVQISRPRYCYTRVCMCSRGQGIQQLIVQKLQ